MVEKIFLFNPGSEAAQAIPSGKHYTPPKLTRRMSADLSPMFRYLIEDDTLVWSPYSGSTALIMPSYEACHPCITTLTASNRHLQLIPWGEAPACHQHWGKLAQDAGLATLSMPKQGADWQRLTDRSINIVILERLAAYGIDWDNSLNPRWLSTDAQLTDAIENCHGQPLIVKLPNSSSGRGLLHLSPKPTVHELIAVRQAMAANGRISIEPRLPKESDWAMEYDSDGSGLVRFVGYSHFVTTDTDRYVGNILDTQEHLKALFAERIGSLSAVETYEKALAEILSSLYGQNYQGPIGVDMLFYHSPDGLRLHPCVEINRRYTMGLFAIELSKRLIPEGAKGFFQIATARSASQLMALSQRLQELHPLTLTGRHLVGSGFFALSTIGTDSLFMPYICAEARKDYPYSLDLQNENKKTPMTD